MNQYNIKLYNGKRSSLELRMREILLLHGFTDWQEELMPIAHRRWRVDIAWDGIMLGVELDGGTWSKGGGKPCQLCGQQPKGQHATGRGIRAAAEKRNALQMEGWRVLIFTVGMVRDGTALQTLESVQDMPSVEHPIMLEEVLPYGRTPNKKALF